MKPAWRALLAVARDGRHPVRKAIAAQAPFLAVALTTVGGWAFLTRGIAAWTHRGDIVWSLSTGLFLLSLAGWRFLGNLFSRGLFTALLMGDRRG